MRADGAYGDKTRQGVVSRPVGHSFRSCLHIVTAGPTVALVSTPRSTVCVDGLFGVVQGKAGQADVDVVSVVEDTQFVGGVVVVAAAAMCA